MNDFTKEELEDIGSCIYAVRSSSSISEMTYGLLQEKVQAMIDNYCDHESFTGSCIKIDGVALKTCSKCGKMFNE